jgi:zinc transport system substrate-binding protein
MKTRRLLVVIVILIIATGILSYFAIRDSNTDNLNGKIGVAVSIGPEVEWVNAIGGDKVHVTLMVPEGADPHTYEPLPNQLTMVSNAKMYVEIGSSIEFETNYMDKIRASNPNMVIVNASQGIQLIPNSAENETTTMDPHVWVDPKNAMIMVNNTYNGLVEVDPADQKYFQKNRDQYLQQLKELDMNTTKILKNKNGTNILVYHPAFGYYAKDYNLTQVGAMLNDEEPSPQRIAKMVDIAKKNNVKVLFNEPQYDPKFMQSIASQINGQVLTVNDLGENYIQNMMNIAIAFSKA